MVDVFTEIVDFVCFVKAKEFKLVSARILKSCFPVNEEPTDMHQLF